MQSLHSVREPRGALSYTQGGGTEPGAESAWLTPLRPCHGPSPGSHAVLLLSTVKRADWGWLDVHGDSGHLAHAAVACCVLLSADEPLMDAFKHSSSPAMLL